MNGACVSGYSGIEEQLLKYGNVASVTEGESMKPLFKTHRDTVVIERVESGLKKYDVVLYKSGGNFVLHRIVKLLPKKGVYIIRGDNTYRNEYVPPSDIIGRLSGFNRAGRGYTSVESGGYRFYSKVWVFIYPIRYVLHFPIAFFKRVFRKIFRKRK